MKKSLQRISPWFWGILLAAVSLAACQKSDPEMDTISQQSNPDIKFISSLGYDVSGIEKVDDGYLVEGDIWLTNQWLADAKKQPQTRLTRFSSLVKQEYLPKLYLDTQNMGSASTSAIWTGAASGAIYEWNKLNCYIQIGIMPSSGGHEIKIKLKNKNDDFGGSDQKLMLVTPPKSDGEPGSVIINLDCKSLLDIDKSIAQAQYLIMHAIGHSLGLGHTQVAIATIDWDDVDRGGTTIGHEVDPKSIMRKERAPLSWSGFSSTDNDDFAAIFSRPKLSAGEIEAKKVLSRNNAKLNIYSKNEGFTDTGGASTYQWEQNLGNKWESILGQTRKDLLDISLPSVLHSQYRRKVTAWGKSDYSNTCYVEYEPLDPGSIEKEMLIETKNPNDQLTIAVKQSAWCPLDPTTYVWESKTLQSTTWTVIPDAKDPNLKINAPLEPAVQYKRKAICSHREHDANRYSNECIVYNAAYIDAGKIPELVEINKTGFDYMFEIPSISESSLPNAVYQWEIYQDNQWITYGYGSSLAKYYVSEHTTKLKRSVSIPSDYIHHTIYTKEECTLINYASPELTGQGSGIENAIKLGPYNTEFQETVVIDTRGEYFRDQDRFTRGGNDAFIELEINQPMTVDFVTGSAPMGVWFDIRSGDDLDEYIQYSDWTSLPRAMLGDGKYIPFPSFDEQNSLSTIITLDLIPGKYIVQIEGYRSTNGGCVNEVICIKMRGRVK